jgi:hypothetical protein
MGKLVQLLRKPLFCSMLVFNLADIFKYVYSTLKFNNVEIYFETKMTLDQEMDTKKVCHRRDEGIFLRRIRITNPPVLSDTFGGHQRWQRTPKIEHLVYKK